MKNIIRNLVITAILAVIPTVSWGADLKAKVNIVLDDGTIMLYSGKKAGVGAGDTFEVFRGGKSVGHIQVKEVQDFVSYATLLDGDVKEMDEATRTESGKPAKTAKEKPAAKSEEKEETKESSSKKPSRGSKSKSSKKTSDDEEAGEDAAAKEEPKAEESGTKKTGSSRREKAAKKDTGEKSDDNSKSAGKEEKKAEKKETKKEPEKSEKKDKKTEEKPKKTPPALAETKTPYLKPLGGIGAGGHGLTGGLFIPTANVMRKGKAAFNFTYVNAEDEQRLLYNDKGIGITYGLGEDIEVSYTYLKTEYNLPPSYGLSSADDTAGIFSFKYQTNYTKAPTFFSSNITETRLALGMNFVSLDQSAATTSSSTSTQENATRLFAVMTGKYSLGVAHLGVYIQQGGALDNTEYEGVGFMGGAEFFMGGNDKGSYVNQLSVIAEYDSDAYYLGTAKTPSIGLRYYFNENSHVTASLLDVTDTAILNVGGAYGFN